MPKSSSWLHARASSDSPVLALRQEVSTACKAPAGRRLAPQALPRNVPEDTRFNSDCNLLPSGSPPSRSLPRRGPPSSSSAHQRAKGSPACPHHRLPRSDTGNAASGWDAAAGHPGASTGRAAPNRLRPLAAQPMPRQVWQASHPLADAPRIDADESVRSRRPHDWQAEIRKRPAVERSAREQHSRKFSGSPEIESRRGPSGKNKSLLIGSTGQHLSKRLGARSKCANSLTAQPVRT